MPRDSSVALTDILEAIGNVEEFVATMAVQDFRADKKTLHAVPRNLEVIGEAARHVPDEVRRRHAAVPWQRIAGLRDVLIHRYFGIDVGIVWDVVRNKLPELKQQTRAILDELKGQPPA